LEQFVPMRKVYTSRAVWWKPWTWWRDWHWERKDGKEE
jgi:hypothetical protein